jgi:hypothetical protein
MANKMKGDDVEATRKMFIRKRLDDALRGYTMSGMLGNNAIEGIVQPRQSPFAARAFTISFSKVDDMSFLIMLVWQFERRGAII